MLGEAAFVVAFFIESHDASDTQSLEHGYVVVHTIREQIGTNSPSFIIRAAESEEFIRPDPVDISVLQLMEVKILSKIERVEIVQFAFYRMLDPAHAVQIRQHKPTNAITRVAERNKAKLDEKAQHIQWYETMPYHYVCSD